MFKFRPGTRGLKGAIARVGVSVELTLSQPRVATVVRSRLTHR